MRGALKDAGEEGVEVSDYAWTEEDKDGNETTANGLRIRTLKFSAASKKERREYSEAFAGKFTESHELLKVGWSGDTMHVRSKKPFTFEAGKAFFSGVNRDIEDWPELDAVTYLTPQEGTGEYNTEFRIHGVDRQYKELLSKSFSGTDVNIVQVYGVGAKAGAQLRNDGIKSLFYALILIMLYLVFRFDIRYAPRCGGRLAARRNHRRGSVRADVDRLFANERGGAAHGHRLFSERLGGHLRPHPGERRAAQGQGSCLASSIFRSTRRWRAHCSRR